MILVVDDHHEVSAALRRLLNHEGHLVHAADCGADALAWLKANCPLLVLMDHMMPDLSGVEVVQQAITDHLISPIRVLFYTAAPSSVAKAVTSLGLGGCISKGTDWEQMRLRIAGQILRASATADGLALVDSVSV